MTYPLVSIIVPVYKVEPFLQKCVDSIVNQSYQHIEIILVDDGSPDKCPTICEELKKTDSRIKVVHQNNQGLPKARRSGFQISTGDYIFFVDSDDYIHKDCIEILISHAIKSNADVTVAGIYNVYGDYLKVIPRLKSGVYGKKAIEQLLSRDYLFNHKTKVSSYPLYAWGKLIKKEVMDGYFEVSTQFRYWEDIPSTFFLMKKINSLEIVDDNLYYYVIHANQVTQKPLEDIWHYYVDVWCYLEKTDKETFLQKQLPQRIWWVIVCGLQVNIRNKSSYREFKKLYKITKETPVVNRQIANKQILEPQALTYKILHFFYMHNMSRAYYFLVKNRFK